MADAPVLVKRGVTSAEYFAGEETSVLHNLLDGDLYRMPRISRERNDLLMEILEALQRFEDRAGGEIILSPLDCEFTDGTVLQPDLGYVRPARTGICRDWIRGVPDLAIEILCAGAAQFQRERKLAAYERFGVPEAWIVDPVARTVTVHEGANGAWVRTTTVAFGEPIPSTIVEVGAAGL